MATALWNRPGAGSPQGLLLALLVTQIVAFPCSIFFGRLSRRMDAKVIISICIGAYFGIAVFAFWLNSLGDFWILAVWVGMFQGTIQAISSSLHYTKIIPAERAGEYFGIYDICGKGAAFTGTLLVSVISQLTNSTNAGVGPCR
ncbi:MAG: MFS transporter [Oscillospiraceae bacterium]